MKRNIMISLLLMLVCCTLSAADKKSDLRVLYLGGQADWVDGKRYEGQPKKFAEEKDFQKSIDQRMAAFGQLLRKYFKTVKVMKATDYKPEMSADYDVTIFDGKPTPIVKGGYTRDEDGNVTGMVRTTYLPDDFNYPAVTIGSLSDVLGHNIGVKNDWYCLCLDADAHHFKADHPIFNGPWKTKMTLKKKPTPEEAFHFQCYYDEPIPDSLMMWEVQTRGYKTDPLFEIGMVSRPWGYEDSPDCENISSGVCAKKLDAVAIGRHGNFLHWGFVASPLFMTNEAKVVFANAVAYIAQFKGTRIARKMNPGIGTREILREQFYLISEDGYKENFESENHFKVQQRKGYYAALEKQQKGEKLTNMDKYYLDKINGDDVDDDFTYGDHMRKYLNKQIFEVFGEDPEAIKEYYTRNAGYLYGGEGTLNLVLDLDVKSIGIPNNDKRLLERAISDWEQGKQKSRAKRILTRYTLCRFDTPQEWRQWYDTYKDKLFFTESGGWLWLVNSTDPATPGNDYAALKSKEKEKPKAPRKRSGVEQQPTAENPVVVDATLESKDGMKSVKLSFKMYKGFHLYDKVAASDSYIPLVIRYELPQGVSKSGREIKPEAVAYGTTGTTIYSDELTIVQPLEGSGSGKAVVTVSYQACDDHVCIPPQEKKFTLNIP